MTSTKTPCWIRSVLESDHSQNEKEGKLEEEEQQHVPTYFIRALLDSQGKKGSQDEPNTEPRAKNLLSDPLSIALISVTGTLAVMGLYWRYFRRIRNAEHLTPSVLRYRKTLVGKVTSVGDADGFRLFHTPGIPFLRSWFYVPPTKPSQLRNETLSIRLAGADAPEAAHFGKEAQPFSKEAHDELKRLVLGKTCWVQASHVDQYKRLVGTPYVFEPPYIFGRTNVSLHLVKNGLATVYRSAGASYGRASFWSKTMSKATDGLGRLERAERNAKRKKLGMWSLGNKLETPEAYKRRTRSET
ncbi:SNase-domain-containing protein [Violaceomyces palustris]|uniref:SNase-domain-containing protein n=1 Tax=Violaceomyces palustris TaxID=1673888 RepID=A0ACD0NXS4_9BASI|nr:SNase-domain-containing protein [Violaceomyces palustris]